MFVSDNKVRTYLSLIGQRTKHLMDQRLLPYDITPQQARIIGFVCSRQRQGTIVNQRDIEEAFELRGSSITSLLQGLQRKNFIVRHPDPDDERRKIVTVLPKGEALMSEFEVVFHEIDERMMQGIAPEQQQQLVQALEQMARNLA
ncbi:MarR family transcriptional regulator [Reticulibacter mediterranei]|uniref:MarR family transcriptional regulator n=1 Tax=Reticulibacter mediterranei TaxID=2778369 RepID=A0A8J3IF02_9CHLR|nr:MarR family transcriptional regulator [Reticulibacter mediterranei]GHO92358.1 MarR family transcriptional regulator [Reticulibacter mediterranei]